MGAKLRTTLRATQVCPDNSHSVCIEPLTGWSKCLRQSCVLSFYQLGVISTVQQAISCAAKPCTCIALAKQIQICTACTGHCYRISQPSSQRRVTAFTTTFFSSRVCWLCIKTHKTPHRICPRPTQLQQSMQRDTSGLLLEIWRKSGQATSSSCMSSRRGEGA